MNWTLRSRVIAFCLGASSIAALIAHFYGLVTMHVFVPAITLPCFVAIGGWMVVAKRRGWQGVWSALFVAVAAGIVAAIAYDVFRLPFVMMRANGVDSPYALPLFKVFVRFGAMILGQPVEQEHYAWLAHLLGWTYHFSNAIGFGLMYVAMVGNPRHQHWGWAVVMSLALEEGMLLMPYAQTFSIHVGIPFVVVTVTAHTVFGLVLGLTTKRMASRAV